MRFAWIVPGLLALASVAAAEPPRRNAVLLIADDLGLKLGGIVDPETWTAS